MDPFLCSWCRRACKLALMIVVGAAMLLGSSATANPLSKEELDQLEHVWNCRDVAWEVPNVVKGKLLRCGNSDNATARDVELITRHFGKISAMVDLRTLGEVDPTALKRLREHAKHHSVPLGDREALGTVIAERASWWSVLKYLYHRFIEFDLRRAQSEMVQYLNGLSGFNQLIIINEGKSISKALKIITESVEHDNVLISCTAGKDRTGLIVSLSLAIAGVSKELIAKEYHQSHRHRATILQRAIQHLTDVEEWSGAPERVVFETFAFIEHQFGTLELFLASIDFDHSWQSRLRAALTKTESVTAQGYFWNRIL